MKKFLSLSAFVMFAFLFSSKGNDVQPSWNINFQNSKVFIENRGQFSLPENCGSEKVIYAYDNGASMIYFTATGVTYSLKKIVGKKNDEERKEELEKPGDDWKKKEEEEKRVDFISDAVTMHWQNANADVQLMAMNPAGETFSYSYYSGKETREVNAVPAFKKIIYKNLYAGIDVVYEFHPVEGIKYSIIIHPGADASLVKMIYSGNRKLILQNGDLKIATLFGNITDHAPKTFYGCSKEEINSSFIKKQNTISFFLGNYDHSKEIIIDPWTVNPAMPNSQKVWEIEADSSGNAYIYGGDWPNCKLQKYNLAGVLQWTNITAGYDSSSWIGTLATDLVGNSYVTIGSSAAIKKVNTSGATQWNVTGGLLDEYWSLAFNCDYTKLICGGTRLIGFPFPTGSGRAFDINTSNGSVNSNVMVANALPSFLVNDPNEIRSICASPNGKFYFHTLDTIGELTTSMGINWRLLTSYSFAYSSPNYGFTPQPQHVIRATDQYLYTMNGQTIFRRNISTGVVINSAAIPGGSFYDPPLVQGISPNNNGIAIDGCGNVYVGSTNAVVKYDAALNQLATYTTPGVVYDVAIGKNGAVLVCGNGYAASVSGGSCNPNLIVCSTGTTPPASAFNISDNTICKNTCITFADQSTNNPTSWSWTFAGGNPSSSSLQNPGTICYPTQGTYAVTLSVTNAGGTNSSSQTVTVYNTPNTNAGNDTAVCSGISATLHATGGTSFLWTPTAGLNNPNIASPVATPTVTTTYTVVGTNANGCTNSDEIVMTIHPLPNVIVTPAADTICKGMGATLIASGASTYSWSPNVALNTTTGSGVFANPGINTTYTATGTDLFGCKSEATSIITVADAPLIAASIQNATPCPGGGSITLTVIGGVPPIHYQWSNGATTSSISNLVAGNYTVTVEAGPCSVINTYAILAGVYNPVLNVSNLYSCSARLNWTATASVSYYKVRYKVAGTTTWSPVINAGSALYYDFTGLAANTNYTFSVAAYCASNQNLGWRSKNGKTQICTAPINPVVTNLTSNSATVSWTSACSPVNFQIQYRKVGTTAWSSIITSATTVIINNLTTATQYEYKVRSGCGATGNSAFTSVQNFTTPRMEDTESENQFAIFPNPNSGSFMIQIPELKIASKISVYNSAGQLVKEIDLSASESSSSLEIKLENVADGLYEVVLSNTEQTITKRVMIQK